jgi:hypothetical protein
MWSSSYGRGSFGRLLLVALCLILLPMRSFASCYPNVDFGISECCSKTDDDDSESSNVTENNSLYMKIHFKNPIKPSALKAGSVLEGTLAEAVYSGDREVFPAGSNIRLRVDRMERKRKPPNDHWPWVVKAFSPRHEMQPVFSSASVVLASGETAPLSVSIISMSQKKDAHFGWKSEKDGASRVESTPVSLGSPTDASGESNKPTRAGTTATFEAIESAKSAVVLSNRANERATYDSFSTTTTIGAGTEARVILLTAVSASKNRPGDIVTARVVEPVRIGSGAIVPEGSIFEGKVEKVSRPKWLSRSGSMLVTFDRLTLPSGSAFPVVASVVAAQLDAASRTQIDSEGELHGGRPGRTWMLINLGAAMGLTKAFDDGTQLVIEAIVSTATDVSTAGVARIAGFCVSGVFMITRRGRDVILPRYTELRIALDKAAVLQIPR